MLRLCLPERDCTVKRMVQKITKRNLYSLQCFDQHSEAVCIHAVVLVQRRRYSYLANYPWPIPELVGLKKPLSPGVCHKELAKAQTRFMFYMHDKQYLQVVPCYFYPCGRHITLQGLSTSQAPYSSTINKFNNLSNTFVIWRHPLVWSAFSALSSGTSVEKGDPSNYMPIVNIISNRLCSMETV